MTAGNPPGIRIMFRSDSFPIPFQGRAEIYAANQIPVPGFSSRPLAVIPVPSGGQVFLDSADLSGLAEADWPEGSITADSTHRLNIVLLGDSIGSILHDLAINKTMNRFGSFSDGKPRLDSSVHRIEAIMSPLEEMRCYMDTEAIASSLLTTFLFVQGTGFVARGIQGEFVFPSLPEGAYNLAAISLFTKDRPSSQQDSVYLFSLDREALTGRKDSLSIASILGAVPMPDSLKGL